MTLTPTAANEQRIQYLMESGEYANIDEVLAAALDRLSADKVVQETGHAEFQKMLDEGWEEAERGETVSAEEARVYLAQARRA